MALLVKHSIVWEVSDNFQKQTYRNRFYIATDQGKHMLNIPIQHVGGHEGRQLYKDVRLDHSMPWPKQHWKTLQTAYRTSPFFEFYEDELAPLFQKKHDFLMDFNLKSIEFLCEALQIAMPQVKTETYQKSPTDIEDARKLVIAKSKIALDHSEYVQVFGERHGFIPNLSTLDLLFNKGPESLAYLQKVTLTNFDA